MLYIQLYIKIYIYIYYLSIILGLAIQWGAIDNVGFVSQHNEVLHTSITKYNLQNIDDSLHCLHKLLHYQGSKLII